MTGAEGLALAMIVAFIALVFTGYPIAWILGGLAVVFTGLAIVLEVDFAIPTGVDWFYTALTVDRIWDVMENWVMVALPMFIFMGVLLDRSGIARSLLEGFARLFGRLRGGLAIAVTVIGVLLAASTGIIGASVVLLGLLGLPAMLENRYDKRLAAGTVCAVGTLGILIPPSIMLVVMADRMAMSVGDLFLGAVLPGMLLGGLYIGYLLAVGVMRPARAPAAAVAPMDWRAAADLALAVVPAALLILAVLGSIFFGLATPTEAAGVGAAGALLLAAAKGTLNRRVLAEAVEETSRTTAFIFRRHPRRRVLHAGAARPWRRRTGEARAARPALRPHRHRHLHPAGDLRAGLLSGLAGTHPHHPAAGGPGGGGAGLRPGVVHGDVRRLPANQLPHPAGRRRPVLPARHRPAGRGPARDLPRRGAVSSYCS